MQPDEVAAKKKSSRRTVWWVAGGFTLLLALYFLPPIIDAFLDLRREGFLDDVTKKEYEATSMENLKALFQANQLYYEANEVMPGAANWMDDLSFYVRTADLKQGEEIKKFINPRIPAGEGVFGYAYNAALSGAWLEEIENPTLVPLVFESEDTMWNANGEPAALQPEPELPNGNKTVTVEGNATLLRDLLRQGDK